MPSCAAWLSVKYTPSGDPATTAMPTGSDTPALDEKIAGGSVAQPDVGQLRTTGVQPATVFSVQ